MTRSDNTGFSDIVLTTPDKQFSQVDELFAGDGAGELISTAVEHLMDATPVTPEDTAASSAQLSAMIRAAEAVPASTIDGTRNRRSRSEAGSFRGHTSNAIRNTLAGVAAFAVIGIALFQFGPQLLSGSGEFTSRNTGNVVATAAGQSSRVEFPDGSVALLGPKSRIQYSTKFGQRDRVVSLDGEALFTVIHATGTPFTVRTNSAVARVLGTSFTVRRYPLDTTTQVIVAEGRVAVTSINQEDKSVTEPIVLVSGERGTVHNSGLITQVRVSDIGAALAWTQGRVEFNDAELYEVAANVSRMYDIDLHIESESLGRTRITGAIEKGSSTPEVIRTLAAAVGARVEHCGNTITLAKK